MTSAPNLVIRVVLTTTLLSPLAACTQSQMHVTPDLGVALNAALAAQIADPDAHHSADPPKADGSRVGLAQARYRTGTVIPPRVVDTTTIRATTSSPR